MAKRGLQLTELGNGSVVTRKEIYNFYINKYYNLYMNAYKWSGIDYQAVNFIMTRFWADGSVACFKMDGTEGSKEYPEGQPVFTPYAPTKYNIYNFATFVTLINLRGVKFIPTRVMKVDKDVVLGWTQRNKKSVFFIVDHIVRKIVDVEMTIRTNLKAHKTPWLISVSPEDEAKVKTLYNNIDKDDSQLFVDLEDIQNAKALVSGAPYIIDKLYAYKNALENELKEYLGITNLGNQEKKEHLITSEVDANSEITEASGDCFYDVLVEFTKRIKEVLGITINVELNKPEQYYLDDEKPEDEGEVEDETM